MTYVQRRCQNTYFINFTNTFDLKSVFPHSEDHLRLDLATIFVKTVSNTNKSTDPEPNQLDTWLCHDSVFTSKARRHLRKTDDMYEWNVLLKFFYVKFLMKFVFLNIILIYFWPRVLFFATIVNGVLASSWPFSHGC